jgi:hypothetical protein
MASITCPNCQTVATAGTPTCPSCGNALGAPQATTYGASAAPPPAASYASSSPPPPASAGPGAQAKPQIKFDLSSIGRTDRLVGGGTLVLFIALFLPWFSVSFGPLGSASASGLTAHGYLYIVLILAIAVIALLVAEALGVWKLPATSPLSREQMLLIATGINFVLVLIAFLLKPGGDTHSGVGWSFGAFVGLIAAVVAAFPLAYPVIQARRGK